MPLKLLLPMVAAYAAGAMARELVPGRAAWMVGLILFHGAAFRVLRFFSNAPVFEAGAVGAAAAIEAGVFGTTHLSPLAIWAGAAGEAAAGMWLARRFYRTMGD